MGAKMKMNMVNDLKLMLTTGKWCTCWAWFTIRTNGAWLHSLKFTL